MYYCNQKVNTSVVIHEVTPNTQCVKYSSILIHSILHIELNLLKPPRTSSCVRRVQIGSSVADILGRNLFHFSASSDVRGMGSGDYMPAPHALVVWCNCVVLFAIPEGSLIGLCCVLILRIWRATS